MTTPNDIDERIERGLRSLTAWEGDAPPLLDRAVATAATGARSAGARRATSAGSWWSVAGIAAILLLGAVVVGIMVPSLGRARQSSRSSRGDAFSLMDRAGVVPDAARAVFPEQAREVEKAGFDSGERVRAYAAGPSLGTALMSSAGQPPGEPGPSAAPSDRQVIRKATMELKAADVRATFLKASLIPHAGEYVEDSAMTGEGPALSANLTLRVAAARLPEVLNQLRELGKVTGEQVRGEDVTSQVVDLDARLRNERRVEQELLGLMDTRPDAPLKEVLELRERLSEVRGEIEQLDAQQAKLARLVSLATVLVLIRPMDAAVPEPQKVTILTHLYSSFTAAWRAGIEYLINSGAWIVQVAVGGLLWWVVLVAGIVIVRRYLRRAALLRGEV